MAQRQRVEKVFLNGAVVSAGDACNPAADTAGLSSDGIFETVRAYRGQPFRLERHLERLEDGCRLLRFELPYRIEEIADAIMSLLEENGLKAVSYTHLRAHETRHDL